MDKESAISGAAFGELVQIHYRDWYQLALRRVGRHQDAEDLVQDALLRAQKKLIQCRGKVGGWVARIIVRLHATLCERKRPSPQLLSDIVDESIEESMAEGGSETEDNTYAWLRIAVAKIPSAYHPVTRALIECGEDTKRVAHRLGVRPKDVRARKSRLRSFLADSLGTGEFLRVLAIVQQVSISDEYVNDWSKHLVRKCRAIKGQCKSDTAMATEELAYFWYSLGAELVENDTCGMKVVVESLAESESVKQFLREAVFIHEVTRNRLSHKVLSSFLRKEFRRQIPEIATSALLYRLSEVAFSNAVAIGHRHPVMPQVVPDMLAEWDKLRDFAHSFGQFLFGIAGGDPFKSMENLCVATSPPPIFYAADFGLAREVSSHVVKSAQDRLNEMFEYVAMDSKTPAQSA